MINEAMTVLDYQFGLYESRDTLVEVVAVAKKMFEASSPREFFEAQAELKEVVYSVKENK